MEIPSEIDEALLCNTWMLESVIYQLCNCFLSQHCQKSTSRQNDAKEASSCMDEGNKSCATCLYHWSSLWKHLLPLVPSHMIDKRLRHWIVLVKLLATHPTYNTSSDDSATSNIRAFELLVDAIESQTVTLRIDDASASAVTKYLHTKIVLEYFKHQDIRNARRHMQKYPIVSEDAVNMLLNDNDPYPDVFRVLWEQIFGYIHSVMGKLGRPAVYSLIGRAAAHMVNSEGKALSEVVERFVVNNFDNQPDDETTLSGEELPAPRAPVSPVFERNSLPGRTTSLQNCSTAGSDIQGAYNGSHAGGGCAVVENRIADVGKTPNTDTDSVDDDDETQGDALPDCGCDFQVHSLSDFSRNIRSTSNNSTTDTKYDQDDDIDNKINSTITSNNTENGCSDLRDRKFRRLPKVKVCIRKLGAPELSGFGYSVNHKGDPRVDIPVEITDEDESNKESVNETLSQCCEREEEQESLVSSTTDGLNVPADTSQSGSYKNNDSPNIKNHASKFGTKRKSGGKPLFSTTSPVYQRIHDEQRKSTSKPKQSSPSKILLQRHSSPLKVSTRHHDDSGESVSWTSSDEEEDMVLLQLTERKRKQRTNSGGESSGNVTDGQRPSYKSTLGNIRAKRKGGRMKFSAEEEQYVIDGVTKYGVGNWAMILNTYDFHDCRDNVSIKDKYRNLLKQGRIPEK